MPSDVLITPASSKIEFTDGNNATKTLKITNTSLNIDTTFGIGTTTPLAQLHINSTTSGGTVLRTDGTNGTLFSVIDDLSSSLMSVNNSAGLPVLEVFADDRVVAGQYGTNDFIIKSNKIGIGTENFSYTINDNSRLVGSNTNNILFVNGSVQLLNNNDAFVVGRGTATFLSDEELGFGWGGGWYMTDTTYLRIRNDKTLYTAGEIWGSIFKDSNNTAYYIDPASTSNLVGLTVANTISGSINGNSATATLATKATRANGNFYIDDNYGNTVVGLYSANRLQGVFAMGDSYKLAADGTGVGTLYGIAWSHPNAGGVASNLSNHGALVLLNGTYAAAISTSIRCTADMRTPIYYDSDNTAYYIDPASTSNLNTITAAGNITAAQYYNNGWFRNNNSGNGLYNESTGQHFYSDDVSYWNVASSATVQGIRFRTGGYAGTVRGYVYANDSNDVGLLNNSGNWRIRVVGGDYTLFDGSSIRAPLFYDSNNTAFYVDPASTSVLNSLTVTDANLELYKSQTVDMSNTTTYSTSNYYPVTIPVPTEGCIIQIQNNLNSNVPSWATHAAGFTLNLKWRTNGLGWGTTQVRRIIDQYYESFTNQTICGGITQMGNSSTEVVWLRGGGQYLFKFSRNLSATAQSATYTVSSQSVSPTSTAQNTIWSSASGTSIQYNDQTISTTNMYTPVLYDWNNSAYYVDPASTSNLVGLTVANTITGSVSGNAVTAGGLAVHTGTNNEANKIVRTDSNGYIQAGWINTTSGDQGTTAIDRVYASYDGYIRYYTPANFRTVLDVPTRGGSGASGSWGISITGNAATATTATTATGLNSSNYISRVGSSGNYNTDFQNTPAGTVRHLGDDSTATNNPGGAWWFVDNYRHSNSSNYWGTQVAWGWEDNANKLATRNITGGTFGSWVYYLNSGNYSNYAIARGGDTVDGVIYFRSNKGSTSTVGANNSYQLEAYSSDAGAAGMSFHRGGYYAVNMGLDPDNVLRIGGWSASADRWQLDMSGNNWVASSFRAPIFYDSNDTTYYLDAANTTTSLLVAGSIGIGTTSPATKLHVIGSAGAARNVQLTGNTGLGSVFQHNNTVTASSRPVITLRNTQAGDTSSINRGAGIQFDLGYGGNSLENVGTRVSAGYITLAQESNADWTVTADRHSYLSFATISAGTVAERMRISSVGNVTINGSVTASSFIGNITKTSTTQTITGNSALTIDVAAAYIHIITIVPSGGTFGISSITYNNRKAGPEVDEIILVFKWPATGSGVINVSNIIGDTPAFNYGKATAVRLTSYKGTGGLWICEQIASNMDYTNL